MPRSICNLLFSLLVLLIFGCGRVPEDGGYPEIIAGTSHIQDIASDLTDAAVSAHILLPSGACPSQFDLRAADITRLQQARLVILHSWQLDLANIRRVIEASGAPEARRRIVDVPGNWMLPDAQTAATRALAELLADEMPEKRLLIAQRLEARLSAIEKAAASARDRLEAACPATTAALCNELQRPVAVWAGLEVIAAFGRPEDWSVSDAERLVRLGREHKVALVIDNLQSGGAHMSKTLARDMAAAHVVLSNFPGGFPDTPSWESAFNENIKRLLSALESGLLP